MCAYRNCSVKATQGVSKLRPGTLEAMQNASLARLQTASPRLARASRNGHSWQGRKMLVSVPGQSTEVVWKRSGYHGQGRAAGKRRARFSVVASLDTMGQQLQKQGEPPPPTDGKLELARDMGIRISCAGEFVHFFREATPYIQGFRGSTFVILIPGEVIANQSMIDGILQDVALLHGLGIKIVIVPGTHVQIDDLLKERGHEAQYVGAYRITDPAALNASMEAAGKIRVNMEAKLSRPPYLPILRRHGDNGRWHEAGISVASGNYVAAKRRGVVDGVDFEATGEVKRIDVARIKERLDSNCIVLLSNLGYSKTGEVLNCNTYEVATACAVALNADKLLCLLDGPVYDDKGRLLRFLTLGEADQLIRKLANKSYAAADYVKAVAGAAYVKSLGIKTGKTGRETSNGSTLQKGAIVNGSLESKSKGFAIGGKERLSRTYGYLSELTAAIYVCRAGVRRVHILDSTIEGTLLLELYTRDGSGTMISSDMYEGTRSATVNDVACIEQLLRPLEESGVLVNRSREQLLQELDAYTVVERDGSIIACAALYPYLDDKCGEVAAFAVSPECRGLGQGDSLLDFLEKKAAKMGLEYLFLLTTRTADWFVSRGFNKCTMEALPQCKRDKIDLSRGSKYYLKDIEGAEQEGVVQERAAGAALEPQPLNWHAGFRPR